MRSGVERVLAQVRERVGDVDVLVNNAGVGDQALFDRTGWERDRAVLRTNVFAVVQLTAALVPAMVERGRGGVLNVGSGAGLTRDASGRKCTWPASISSTGSARPCAPTWPAPGWS